MKKIAVLSDTHDVLLPLAKEIIDSCDVVIHAGDFAVQGVLDSIRYRPEIYAVRGNCDGSWAGMLRQTLTFTVEGVRFALAHRGEHLPHDAENYDVMICGHTHIYRQKKENHVLYLNPGSAGRRGGGLSNTMAVMQVENGRYSVEKIVLREA